MYADKQRRKALRRKLATLKQTGSASKFASEFLTIANILDVDEESRFALFTNGLKPEVQRALAIARDADTFEELVNSAVQIDHVNYTLAKAEAKVESKSSGKSGSGKGNTPPSSRPQQPRNDSNPSSSPPSQQFSHLVLQECLRFAQSHLTRGKRPSRSSRFVSILWRQSFQARLSCVKGKGS
jgi:hypothetical protein